MLKYVLILAVIFASCSPQKRLNRIIERNPEVLKWDTLQYNDTILIPSVKIDTFIRFDTGMTVYDTIVIRKDNLIIKTVRVNDSIYIQGEVIQDTVFIETKIPYTKIEVIELTFWQKNKTWIIALLVAIIGIGIVKKIGLL